jgi:hypothetical protein
MFAHLLWKFKTTSTKKCLWGSVKDYRLLLLRPWDVMLSLYLCIHKSTFLTQESEETLMLTLLNRGDTDLVGVS